MIKKLLYMLTTTVRRSIFSVTCMEMEMEMEMMEMQMEMDEMEMRWRWR